MKTVIGAEKRCLVHLPNILWVGSFASSLMSVSSGRERVFLCLLPIFLPCGSHVVLLNDTGMSQQGPWRRRGCLLSLLGAGGGGEVKEAVFE